MTSRALPSLGVLHPAFWLHAVPEFIPLPGTLLPPCLPSTTVARSWSVSTPVWGLLGRHRGSEKHSLEFVTRVKVMDDRDIAQGMRDMLMSRAWTREWGQI